MPTYKEDYSGLSAAAGALEGFSDSFMKGLEFNARLKSEAEKAKREAQDLAIKAHKEKIVFDPTTGAVSDRPLNREERVSQEIGAGEHGVRLRRDESGNVTDWSYDPNSPKMIAAKTAGQIGLNRNDRAQENLENRKDIVDRREHENVLRRINSNPNVKQRLTQYQNLGNSLNLITQSDSLTPQQIMEFQQAVRSNLGIKGTSGIGERDETYFKTLGMNAANWKQFLTGDPAKLSKDSSLMHHFKQLAQIEQSSIAGQFDKSLKAASGGHKSMYDRRPDLLADLQDAVVHQKGQLEPVPQAPEAQGLVAPGLVSPKKGFLSGLVDKGKEMIGMGQEHPQDQEALTWAKEMLKQNPNDPKAQAILKANGL